MTAERVTIWLGSRGRSALGIDERSVISTGLSGGLGWLETERFN
jgi:hypothetical protein